jgi:hypothetical protein
MPRVVSSKACWEGTERPSHGGLLLSVATGTSMQGRGYLLARFDFLFDFARDFDAPRVVPWVLERVVPVLAFVRLLARFLVVGVTRSGSFALPVSRFQPSKVSGEISPLTKSSANFRRWARLLKRIALHHPATLTT